MNYRGFLIVIPVILCTFFLVGSYALLTYRELKDFLGDDHVALRDILRVSCSMIKQPDRQTAVDMSVGRSVGRLV